MDFKELINKLKEQCKKIFEKTKVICSKVIEYCKNNTKIIIPVIIVLVVAIIVSVALNKHHDKKEAIIAENETNEASMDSENGELNVELNVPMSTNTDDEIFTLICTYYNAWATGDEATLVSLCDYISEQDLLRFVETAKYINHYDKLEIYTKPGPAVDSVIAFVYYTVVFTEYEDAFPAYQALYICKDENGERYIKRSDNTPEEDEAIQKLISEDDVVEFNNKITVEYNDLMAAKPELLDYLSNLDNAVSQAVGELLAASTVSEGDAEADDADAGNDTEVVTEDMPEVTVEVTYATATTTVNVRVSDSEKADKLGKVSGGSKLKVLETRANGWTKIEYEGKEGFIKTEFLNKVESVNEADIIGKATATTNINVRSSADEGAERLGVLAGGETVDLLAVENGWCKVSYNGQVGYLKAEYAEIN